MVGIDIVDVKRIESAAKNEHFLTRVFTSAEREYFHSKGDDYKSLAGMWCVKEAVSKALGSGVVFPLTDIETLHLSGGKPYVRLDGKAYELLAERKVEISISHTDDIAVAVAVIA